MLMYKNLTSVKYSLTRYQARTLAVLIGLMALDFTITSWGLLLWPGFQEANLLFARYMHTPPVFVSFLLVVKVATILWIIIAVLWFNTRDDPKEGMAGGNIICTTAVIAMSMIMAGLIVFNLAQFF